MIRIRKQLFVFTFIIIFTVVMAAPVIAISDDNDELPVTSAAAIIVDFDTGLVIYEFNADEQRVPASMTKMAAALVVFDAVRDGLVRFDSFIDISFGASMFSFNRAYTNVPMPDGSSYSVRELLDAVIIRSAGAATVALGEGIFGSEDALIAKMNDKMEQLGIDAHFRDSWGGSPQNRISARGMAELTRVFIKEYPDILDITSQSGILFDDISYGTTNLLINNYDGVDGFKTGFTNPAGWCFTATALQDGRRLITVTMGSEQGYRFSDTVILLDYGFSNYNKTIADHFRSNLQNNDFAQYLDSKLVPISMLNIKEAQYLQMRDLAIILNES